NKKGYWGICPSGVLPARRPFREGGRARGLYDDAATRSGRSCGPPNTSNAVVLALACGRRCCLMCEEGPCPQDRIQRSLDEAGTAAALHAGVVHGPGPDLETDPVARSVAYMHAQARSKF